MNKKVNGRLRQGAAFLVGVGVMAVVLLLVVNNVAARQTLDAIRETQTEGSPTQQRLIDIAEQIRSCTTPEGKCSQRGQKQTAKAVVGINQGTLRVVVAALSCQADGITELEPLARCTIERSKP